MVGKFKDLRIGDFMQYFTIIIKIKIYISKLVSTEVKSYLNS